VHKAGVPTNRRGAPPSAEAYEAGRQARIKQEREAVERMKAEGRRWRAAEQRRDELRKLQDARREEQARRHREAVDAAKRKYEQERLAAQAARYAKVRDAAATWHAEVEFERRERAALSMWLARYGDILTGEAQ
jgi:hypothetical protein